MKKFLVRVKLGPKDPVLSINCIRNTIEQPVARLIRVEAEDGEDTTEEAVRAFVAAQENIPPTDILSVTPE